ncbi:hypothetical protein L195_g010393 [Trifolium pratense]|uniref:Uncharacterized protein n=1 Tax=Trifolium pratense TaxID=57577 RepID=A0A2K3PEK3_TRIPR|nr:hypothetical protein L195_g010393 [Trifolium pratense]
MAGLASCPFFTIEFSATSTLQLLRRSCHAKLGYARLASLLALTSLNLPKRGC